LEGSQKEVAVQGYEEALKLLFLSGAGLAALMVFLQAGAGWKAAGEESVEAGNEPEQEREELLDGAEDTA
jgi:hypothetical protein